MPTANEVIFAEAAIKAAELRRAWDAEQWELAKRAIAKGLMPAGLTAPQGMPEVELFPIAPHPR